MKSQVDINRWLVLTNSSSAALTYLLNASVLLWAHQYLLRRISADEYSIYPVVIGTIAIVPLVMTMLLSGIGRYAVEAYARSDDRRLTEIASTMAPLLAVGGAVVVLLFSVLAWRVDDLLKIPSGRTGDARTMLMLLALSAGVRGVLTPFGLGLYVRQKFVTMNLIRIGGPGLPSGRPFVTVAGRQYADPLGCRRDGLDGRADGRCSDDRLTLAGASTTPRARRLSLGRGARSHFVWRVEWRDAACRTCPHIGTAADPESARHTLGCHLLRHSADGPD